MKNKSSSFGIKKILSFAGTAVLILIILAVVYLSYSNSNGRVAFVANRAVIRIISGSMEPAIPTGEYILVEKATQKNSNSLSEGDVIMFYCRDESSQIFNRLNTHRIVEIIHGDYGIQYITKGDNNEVRDSLPVNQKDVVGKYVKNLDGLTDFAALFQKKWAFFLIIVIPAAALLMISIREIIRRTKEVKKDLLVAEKVRQMKQDKLNGGNSDNNSGKDDTDV